MIDVSIRAKFILEKLENCSLFTAIKILHCRRKLMNAREDCYLIYPVNLWTWDNWYRQHTFYMQSVDISQPITNALLMENVVAQFCCESLSPASKWVFVFSDNIANYCQIDTNSSSDAIVACLEKVLKDKSTGSQMAKDNVNQMYRDSMQDTVFHAVADSAKYKNDSAGFEANVLVPLQEKSAKSTDERGDIEVLTLVDMENYKILNKLIQAYATSLSVQSFNDFGSFEMNSEAISDISEESNAASENKSTTSASSSTKEESSDKETTTQK